MRRTLQYALVLAAMVAAGALMSAGDQAHAWPCTGINCPGNPDCPDADGDGICNGQDPDYVPPDCGGNPDCPDADGDGICNGQDPDYVRGSMVNRMRQMLGRLLGFVPEWRRF